MSCDYRILLHETWLKSVLKHCIEKYDLVSVVHSKPLIPHTPYVILIAVDQNNCVPIQLDTSLYVYSFKHVDGGGTGRTSENSYLDSTFSETFFRTRH